MKQVQRTQNLVKAGIQLKMYRDKIDDFIQIINSGENFHDDLANDVIALGVSFQGISKLLRPFSVEGLEKARRAQIVSRWRKACRKARTENKIQWIEKYSKRSKLLYGPLYDGPSDIFVAEFCSDIA